MNPIPKHLRNKQMQVRQDFLQNPEVREAFKNQLRDSSDLVAYFWEDFNRDVPEEGCWVAVITPPPTTVRVAPMSLWFALPDPRRRDEVWGFPRWLARIHTPSGDLCLEPWEYVKVPDINAYVGQEQSGVYLHYLEEEASVAEDRLFYLRQRGIAKKDALLMLLGDMRSQNYCYFTMEPAYHEMFLETFGPCCGLPIFERRLRTQREEHEQTRDKGH